VHHTNDTDDKYKTLPGKPEKAISETSEEKIKTDFKVTMSRLIGLRWLLTRSSSWLVYGCRLKKKYIPWG
jgi:hypothetical protein